MESLAAAGPENNPSQNPPSLKVLVCTIQKLLVPEALCTQIADFLRLLSMVEFWRLRAMSVISNVLVYQEYYKELTDRDDSILPQPITRFKDHEKSGSEWRTVFMKILSICIEVVILRSIYTSQTNLLNRFLASATVMDHWSQCRILGTMEWILLSFGEDITWQTIGSVTLSSSAFNRGHWWASFFNGKV